VPAPLVPALRRPIVGAPMAGGISTPALAAAVSGAGGLGFVAGGYATVDALAAEIAAVRKLTGEPFGLNLFVPGDERVDEVALRRYLVGLAEEAARCGVAVGEPRWTDDGWEAKLELALAERPAVVSFTFGCPPEAVGSALAAAGVAVWCTVTTPDEAAAAAAAGANAVVVQGAEAGAHRGSFADDDTEPIALLPLLRLVAQEVDLPLVAAGGVCDASAVAAVLAAGAAAAQVGTAFLLCPEAGTSEPHRRAVLERSGETTLTRAFTGRRARGIVNRFVRDHSRGAPSAYPHVHYATAPLRAAARAAGDADGINLWAGQAYALAIEAPAGEIVRRLSP
jgi:nitronate monooxygenase